MAKTWRDIGNARLRNSVKAETSRTNISTSVLSPAQIAALTGGGQVTVGPGQTLDSIAKDYGVSTEAIIAENKGWLPPVTGQKLKIPRGAQEDGGAIAPPFGGVQGGAGLGPDARARIEANPPASVFSTTPPVPAGQPTKPPDNPSLFEDRKIGQFEIFKNASNFTGTMSNEVLQRIADLGNISYADAATELKKDGFTFNPTSGKWTKPPLAETPSGGSNNPPGVSGNWESGWSIEGTAPGQTAYVSPNIHGSAWQVKIVEVSPGVWERRTVPTYGARGRGGQGGPAHGLSGSAGDFGGGGGGFSYSTPTYGEQLINARFSTG